MRAIDVVTDLKEAVSTGSQRWGGEVRPVDNSTIHLVVRHHGRGDYVSARSIEVAGQICATFLGFDGTVIAIDQRTDYGYRMSNPDYSHSNI